MKPPGNSAGVRLLPSVPVGIRRCRRGDPALLAGDPRSAGWAPNAGGVVVQKDRARESVEGIGETRRGAEPQKLVVVVAGDTSRVAESGVPGRPCSSCSSRSRSLRAAAAGSSKGPFRLLSYVDLVSRP